MEKIVFLIRLWTWFSLRQLRSQYWRTLAVLLGIALGAAVFTSVRLATNASVDSFTSSMESIAGKADWTVFCPGSRVPEELVAVLNKHPAVLTASPLFTTYVRPHDSGSAPFLLIALDPILDRGLRSWKPGHAENDSSPPWLELLSEPYTLIAGKKLSSRLNLKPKDSISLEFAQRNTVFRVLNILSPEGLALAEGGDIALTDISTFQEFTGLHGVVDRIDIRLKPSACSEDVQSIRATLPPGILMERPGEARESGKLMIRSYQINLSVLSFVSLFVGMFLVFSLVALHATSRRHELAVLCSLGASSRLLFSLFLLEGAFLGAAGWIVAIPLASFMVRRLLSQVSATITHLFVRVQVDQLKLDPLEIALSFAITLLVSLLAASQPALQAMQTLPREALSRHQATGETSRPIKWFTFSGILLILMVWPLSQLPGTRGIPLSGYLATFLLFCGFSLLTPGCLRFLGSRLSTVLRNIGGQPAYLGALYVRDAGTRMAISVGALVTATALFVALVIMIHSFRGTVELWVNQSISGDLFLRPWMAEINRYKNPLPPETVNLLQDLDPAVEIIPYRRIFLTYGGIPYEFEAIDFHKFERHATLLFLKGNPDEIYANLAEIDGILISEVFSNQTGMKVGDHFRAQIAGADLDLPVLAVFRDYRTRGGTVYYSLSRFMDKTGDRTWSGARIYLKNRDQDIESAAISIKEDILRRSGEKAQALEIITGNDLRRVILRIFDETFSITTVLLLISLFVAALGITTTLTVFVLERSRQLHTLLAVGASRNQVRSMIFWEAILMVITGEAVGLCCGFFLSYLLIFVINRQSFGWTFIYSVDWTALCIAIPLILSTALLAALPSSQLVFNRPPSLVLRE
ncbi:FtsX-like permease family protein [Desulforhabdus amnigena]|uniref:Permease n=1 Tax=Desulforhabdus amnigena TaxID=40218 RepID=A0A9W6FSR8_9BACT|nr:ABC transporter permease [Desulforhabdus amnigena]NLJ29391.1 ABC transporter permease [Deltaproteobacteria bacterium]GLI34339.1 permease [Desulforhabdus amnigena]